MRTPFLLLAIALPCSFLVPVARAADVKVIANPGVGASTISTEDLKGVFLGTKSSLSDGGRVEPVPEKSAA
jgi:hypothetical protein